jgi:2-methylcitrate dehydratase PrpD
MASETSVSLARLCARRAHKIATSPLRSELQEKATLAIVDYFSSIAAGLQAPWAPSIGAYARSKPTGPCYTWASKSSVEAETAAFCNGFLGHSAIRDDMHLQSNSHIGSMTISSVLAVAQRDGAPSANMLKAIVAGYEMSAVLGAAFQQTEGFNRHIRPSGSCGAFGVAAAMAVLSSDEFNEDVATHAMAFAANMSSGFNQWAWSGGQEANAEMGTAASSGIMAYDLARAGLQCSEDVLEGKAGLFAAYNVGESAQSKFQDWLSNSDVGRGLREVTFKPVPGCNYAQTPIAAATRLHKPFQNKKSTDASLEVEEIQVRSTSAAKHYPGCDNAARKYDTVPQTKMSIQYGVSAVLLYGKPTEGLFQKFEDKEIPALAARCSISPSKEYDEQMLGDRRQPASVILKFSDGTTLEEHLKDVPWLDAAAVKARFSEEVQPLVKDGRTEPLLNSILSLGSQSDCSIMMASFSSQA